MKIIYYCQHVLGIGHFFRSLEICRALTPHRVLLVTGGPKIQVDLPAHVRLVQQAGLMMDTEFQNLSPVQAGKTLEHVKQERSRQLYDLFLNEAPDLFLIELYPFGRRAFRFELEPVLDDIKDGKLPPCQVVCSLRDILVEKENAARYEQRVVERLNRSFDALLIHSDPRILTLDETFSRMDDIAIEVAYTGFVAPTPPPKARTMTRYRLGIEEDQLLVVASAGGGKVGCCLLEAVAKSVREMKSGERVRLQMVSGPFMPEPDYRKLVLLTDDRITVRRFDPEFLSLIAAADLSVSMAGYNTCMNVLAARTPALFRPFAQNREQRVRAERLARYGWIDVLENHDLDPVSLARRMEQMLSQPKPGPVDIDLEGAEHTAGWVRMRMNRMRMNRMGSDPTGRERISCA